MKRFLVFLTILVILGGVYNLSPLQGSLRGFFGDSSYRKSDFPNAEKHYTDTLKTLSGSTLLEADLLYNLGNTLYRLGEKEKDTERLKIWKESVGSYAKSLSIRTDKETEENLAFVEEKLEKEKKEQEQKREEQKKKDSDVKTGTGADKKQEQLNTQSGTTQEEKNWQKEDMKNDQQSGQKSGTGSETEKKEAGKWSGGEKGKPQSWPSWSNQWSYNPLGWQGKDDTNSQLSDADKQEVKKYMEGLKQFQKQNGKLLNPEKSGDAGGLSDQIRNFFGSDSFFQDVLPSDDGKKDW